MRETARKGDTTVREISKADAGTELNVSIGETLELRLAENPTTGYRWQLRSSGDPVLKFVEQSFAPSGLAVGAGGTRRWIFRAVLVGLSRLELEQRRSWERQTIDTFNITIRVAAQ